MPTMPPTAPQKIPITVAISAPVSKLKDNEKNIPKRHSSAEYISPHSAPKTRPLLLKRRPDINPQKHVQNAVTVLTRMLRTPSESGKNVAIIESINKSTMDKM